MLHFKLETAQPARRPAHTPTGLDYPRLSMWGSTRNDEGPHGEGLLLHAVFSARGVPAVDLFSVAIGLQAENASPLSAFVRITRVKAK